MGQAVLVVDDIAIHWPQDGHGRARTILSRSGAKRRYAIPCFRGRERFVHAESQEEADGSVLLDACAGVEFQEQPAKMEFDWRGSRHTHYPDALMVSGQRKAFLEFKRDREVSDLKLRRRTEQLQVLLGKIGFGYLLVCTRQLRRGAFYPNAVSMRRHANYFVRHCKDYREAIEARLALGQVKASRLLELVPEQHRYGALMSLLYEGVLDTNFSLPVSLDSHVHPPLTGEGRVPWVWELFESVS